VHNPDAIMLPLQAVCMTVCALGAVATACCDAVLTYGLAGEAYAYAGGQQWLCVTPCDSHLSLPPPADAHNPLAERRLTKADFVSMNNMPSGEGGGMVPVLPAQQLEEIYDRWGCADMLALSMQNIGICS
jgi:hypothetical protein